MSIEVSKAQEETGLASTISFDMTVPDMTFDDSTAIEIKDKKKTAMEKKKKAALAKKKKEELAKKQPRFLYEILMETYDKRYFNYWHSSPSEVKQNGPDSYACPLLTVGSYLGLTPYVKNSYNVNQHENLFRDGKYDRMCMDHGWLQNVIAEHKLVKCIKRQLECPNCHIREKNEPAMMFHFATVHSHSNKANAIWLKENFYDNKPKQLDEKDTPMLGAEDIWGPQIMLRPTLSTLSAGDRVITMPKLSVTWEVDKYGNVNYK